MRQKSRRTMKAGDAEKKGQLKSFAFYFKSKFYK